MHGTLNIQETPIPAYILEPMRAGVGTLLVFPAIFGLDQDIEELCDELSYMGLHVVAIDPFWSVDPGPLEHTHSGSRRGFARKNQLPQFQGIANALAYCNGVREQFSGPLLVLGIGYGGHLAMCAAAEDVVDGAVLWHPEGLVDYCELAEDIHVPISIQFGEDDVASPPEDISRLRAAFKGRDNAEIHVHPEARYAYSLRRGHHFHEAAFEESLGAIRRMLGLFLEET